VNNQTSKFNQNTTNITIWAPNFFEAKGGIQVYSVFLFNAIQQIIANGKYKLFIKHDSKIPVNFSCPSTKYIVAGKAPLRLRTVVFSMQLILGAIRQKPDLIISTHLNFTPVAHLLKTLLGIPYYTVAHGIEAWNIENYQLKLALKNADKILAVSHYTRDKLIKEQNLDPENILVLPNTFDHQRFKIAPKPDYLLQKYQLKSETKIILTVARLSASEQYKGFDQIIQSLPQIIAKIPNVHYIIVGKGDDRPRIEKLIKGLKLENYVTLAGFIPDEELCDYYNLCDLFAMPSKGEGFGIVYLEAMACGKPCLGGNQDAAIDALCGGKIGALVSPNNIGEIAQTITKILQGSHPLPILYEPELLREKVIEIYGFDKFKEKLAVILFRLFSLE